MKELNKAFKEKWREMVDLKTDLFEIESKIVELHNGLIKEKLMANSEAAKALNSTSRLLSKRPPDQGQSPLEENTDFESKKKNRFSKDSIKILKEWFLENIKNPYPKLSRSDLAIKQRYTFQKSQGLRSVKFKTGSLMLESDILNH